MRRIALEASVANRSEERVFLTLTPPTLIKELDCREYQAAGPLAEGATLVNERDFHSPCFRGRGEGHRYGLQLSERFKRRRPDPCAIESNPKARGEGARVENLQSNRH